MINTTWRDGPGGRGEREERGPRASTRPDDEDAATVIAILTALAAASAGPDEEPVRARSVWADPAHRLGVAGPSRNGWWASGLPRGLPR